MLLDDVCVVSFLHKGNDPYASRLTLDVVGNLYLNGYECIYYVYIMYISIMYVLCIYYVYEYINCIMKIFEYTNDLSTRDPKIPTLGESCLATCNVTFAATRARARSARESVWVSVMG